MKVAFVGKGGSGKTTLASTFSRYLASQGFSTLAIDADINQHLGQSLGMPEHEHAAMPTLGGNMLRIKTHLCGTNERIESPKDMIKTTPPGNGSQLITTVADDPLLSHFARTAEGVQLISVGQFNEDDLGVRCYHSKTGAVELLLNHTVEQDNEYILVDMTAGADAFASGLFTRFDVTFLVVEPTVKSVSVYKQYKEYAQKYDVCIRVIGNKVEDQSDIDFIRDAVGDDLVVTLSRSNFVRNMEKGVMLPLIKMEDANYHALSIILNTVQTQEKDWKKYYEQAVEFHRKNAQGWANDAAGSDLESQIDPNFEYPTTA